jgi:hypothetical protein
VPVVYGELCDRIPNWGDNEEIAYSIGWRHGCAEAARLLDAAVDELEADSDEPACIEEAREAVVRMHNKLAHAQGEAD